LKLEFFSFKIGVETSRFEKRGREKMSADRRKMEEEGKNSENP